MQTSTAERYRYWRSTGLPACSAIAYTRAEARQREIQDRLTWTFEPSPYGTFASGAIDALDVPYALRVLVGDDDQPVEWGDLEPTDDEREHASAFYVAIIVLDDDGTELYHDGIGGVDVIDLPGYLQRDWEDAVAYALDAYLLSSAVDFARNEAAERAEWAARDTITVDS